ncbi:MAG: DUF4830 domain-containing protein [Clostridia bacterium]|nr:DUF4830 domain-containing protein [Clostridia bacterium]
MFVLTVKASGIKFFAAIALAVAVMASLIAILPAVGAEYDVASVNIDYGNISDEADMRAFLTSLGHELDEAPAEVLDISIPEEFNSVFERYNEIQRAQGLNLKPYAGKDATAYTFKVTTYGTEGVVYATLIIRNEKIIAGDVCSAGSDGFVHGLQK